MRTGPDTSPDPGSDAGFDTGFDAGFDADTVEAVLAHMNGDHAEDSLTIVRAHGYPAATSAEMTSLDRHGATWHVVDGHAEAGVRISWPSGPLHERHEVRREVVALHAAARASLGLGSQGADGD